MAVPLPRQKPIFNWVTLRDIGPWTLPYKSPVDGRVVEVELIAGLVVRAFKSNDGQFYFCHGLTFGSKDAPGGAISPFSGDSVRTILRQHYSAIIPEATARPGDILVWRGLDPDTPHSAILLDPVVNPAHGLLGNSSRVLTKNGLLPEQQTDLGLLIDAELGYGDSYQVFRQK